MVGGRVQYELRRDRFEASSENPIDCLLRRTIGNEFMQWADDIGLLAKVDNNRVCCRRIEVSHQYARRLQAHEKIDDRFKLTFAIMFAINVYGDNPNVGALDLNR